MTDATCSICLECDSLETHTKKLQNFLHLSPGFFRTAKYTKYRRHTVCPQCDKKITHVLKISFKTANEKNNFAERIKKIDHNARHSSNENKESSKQFEINFQKFEVEKLNIINWSKDLRSPELDLKTWKQWMNYTHTGLGVNTYGGYAQAVHYNSNTFEITIFQNNMKVSDDVAQSPKKFEKDEVQQ